MSGARLSKETFERLTAELEELTGVGRERIREATEAARAMGSIVENGDYFAVKEEEQLLEERIGYLTGLLADADVYDDVDTTTVTPGVMFEVRFDGEAATSTYLFGEAAERRAGGVQVCTPGSPLGAAVAGAKPGDRVSYRTPTGATLTVTVETITAG